MRQLGWSSWRRDICFSRTGEFFRRFYIVRGSSGFTVSDKVMKDLARVQTFAAAKAWAGIRAGEKVVRHGK